MNIDLTKHYPHGSPEYWQKLATKRQEMIDRLHRKNKRLESLLATSTTQEKNS